MPFYETVLFCSVIYAWRPIKETMKNSGDPDQMPTERGVWPGSTLFALSTGITINMIKIKTTQTPILLEMDQSEKLR